MPNILYRSRFFIALLVSMLLLVSGCKKNTATNPVTENVLEQYFEVNILNRDFKVVLATDNGADLTSNYDGYLFRLLKNTYYDGPMTGTKNGVVFTGTWSTNDDFSKLNITIDHPTPPASFSFLNRAWRFTRKAVPVMELAPWGTTDAKVLHMERL